jgi:hypothetical protein
MKTIPKPENVVRPKFVWLKPCANCPTAHGPGDPESDMYASIPERWKRLRHTFACAWRPNGYCHANYKLQYEGKGQ